MLQTNPLYADRNIAILRTPQYHPELQPIEKCWGVMKQYMAQHCDFTLTGLRKNLETAWTKITSDTLKGIMKNLKDARKLCRSLVLLKKQWFTGTIKLQ